MNDTAVPPAASGRSGEVAFPAAPRQRMAGLTGLRGVGALWVVCFHLFRDSQNPVVHAGWLGVDLFFMMSGFVLAYVYADSVASWRVKDYLHFLAFRLARIYPLHIVMLGVVLAIVLGVPHFADRYPHAELRWGWQSFVASLLLIQNWAYFMATAWNTPSWSLSAEWFAYLLFPLFVIVTQWPRSRWLPLVLAGLALMPHLGVLALVNGLGIGATGSVGMIRMVCEFTAGCLLFRATANGLPPLGRWADGLALALLATAMVIQPTNLLALPACALIVLLASDKASLTARLLSLAPLVALGEISYSVYLVHWPIVQVFNWASAGQPAMAEAAVFGWKIALIAVVLLLSTGTYYLVERPARQLGRRLAS